MGQSTSGQDSVSDIAKWKPHQVLADVFYHGEMKLEVQKLTLELTKKEKDLIFKRLKQHHSHIVRIMHCHPLSKQEEEEMLPSFLSIFVERVKPLGKEDWKPVDTALAILKGFRRLSGSHGFFEIHKDMIGINTQGEIKVWLHKDPISHRPSQYLENETLMISSLINILVENDPQTAIHLIECKTFNDAINTILVEISKQSTKYTRRQNEINKRRIQQIKDKHKQFLELPVKRKKISSINENSRDDHRKAGKSNFYQGPRNKTITAESKYMSEASLYKTQPRSFILKKNKTIDEAKLPHKNEVHLLKKAQSKSHQQKNRASSNNLGRTSNNRVQQKSREYYSFSGSPSKRYKASQKRASVKTNISQLIKKDTIKQDMNRKINPVLRNIFESNKINGMNGEKKLNISHIHSQIGEEIVNNIHSKKLKKLLTPIPRNGEERERQTDILPLRKDKFEPELFEQKKKEKQNFSKKLKVQFGQLLSFRQTGETTKNTDSKTDLTVKQKINKKKRTFAELKKQVSSLLSNQFI